MFASMAIQPADFALIRRHVASGRISVTQPDRGSQNTVTNQASYNYVLNRLRLGSGNPRYAHAQGLIIHECCHAILDERKQPKVSVGTSECLGYISQMMYLRVHSGRDFGAIGTADAGPAFGLQAALAAALAVADEWLAGRQSTNIQNVALWSAVRALPRYSSRYLNIEKFDGIGRRP